MAQDFFERLARIESGGNSKAKSGSSSATGLYQMTRGTFDDLKRTNPSLKSITWEQHEQDPALQRRFANALLTQNEAQLTNKGHDVNDLNRYLAHFAGATGADKLLRAEENSKVGDILGPAAAKANKSLAGMSVSQLKNFFANKLGVQSYEDKRKAITPLEKTPDFSQLSASARPDLSRGPLTSSLMAIPTAMAINQKGVQMAAKGGLLHFKRGKKVKKRRKRDEDKVDLPEQSALNDEPVDASAMGEVGPEDIKPIPPVLSPLQQQAQMAQIQAQKSQAANPVPQTQPQAAPALTMPGQPAAMPAGPGAPPMAPHPMPPAGGLSSQVMSPSPGALSPLGQSPQGMEVAGGIPSTPTSPVEAGIARSANLKDLEEQRALEAATKASGLARGGVVRYREGESVESAPWEDFKSESSGSGQTMPWEDYAAPAAAKVKKTGIEGATFGEKAKNFLGQVFDQTADALNTRPEQITGKDKFGLPIIREKTAQEQQMGPTNAASRAKRTAGFLQGAIFDLPAAIAQMVPGQTGENIANAQLSGYENFRNKLGGKDEVDLSRVIGNIASPGGVKSAGAIENLLSKTGAGLFKRGAVQGSVAGAAQPVAPDSEGKTENLLMDKIMQIGGGATLGGAFNKLLGKPVLPASGGGSGIAGSPVERYKAAFPDADLTWGQHLGGRVNDWEQRATSLPFLGGVIKEARNRAYDTQNVGMMQNALKNAGITLDKGTKAGREMFDQAYGKLTDKYSSLLDDAHLADPQALRAKIYGKMDTGTGKSLATADQLADSYKPGVISNDYNRLSEGGQKRFDKIMDNFFNKFGKDPKGNHSLSMDGNQFKGHEEDFKEIISDYMSGGGEDRTIGRMLKKSLGEMYDSLGSNKAGVADELKKLNKSYAQYKNLEGASVAGGGTEGRFSPVQVNRAVKKGLGQNQVATGKPEQVQLSDLSQQVLGKPYPDSGTAGRLNTGNLAKDLVGGIGSWIGELAYSPKLAGAVLGGGSGAKRAFQGTGLGGKIADYAPKGVPAAVRALLGPNSGGGELAEEEQGTPLARGGLATLRSQPTAHYAGGGKTGCVATDIARSIKSVANHYAAGGAICQSVKKFDEGGQVDPASLVGQDDPAGPRIPQLWDQYTSYLDKNISQGRRDMENGLNYSKEKGLYVKDPEAFKRTMDNMNLAGTFIGPSSKLWNKAAESEFIKRELKEPAKALWKELGVGRDPAGFLKQEISDLGATMKQKLGAMPLTAQQAFEHPKMFEAYPHLKDAFMMRMGGGARGSYQQAINSKGVPEWERISLNPDRLPLDSQKTSTALHEFQHAIQNKENWLPGGSSKVEGAQMAKALGMKSQRETEMHRKFLDQMMDIAKQTGTPEQIALLEKRIKHANAKVVTDEDKFKAYQRLMGEAEARLTQRRGLLNDAQRREHFPFQTGEHGYDVPIEELITGGYRGFPKKGAQP